MKYMIFLCFILTLPSFVFPITVGEIGRLAELKTSDELILKIIEKEKLEKPITSDDVIYLKERGLSENIIDFLWKESFQDKNFLPPQEGESEMIGENLRLYYTTDRNGKKVAILTNLDENGKRMGPPPPPRIETPPTYEPTYEPEPPQEIYVTIRDESAVPPAAYEQDFGTPEYAEPYPYIYNPVYYPVYSTVSSVVFPRHFKNCFPKSHGGHKGFRTHSPQKPSFTANVHGPVQWPGDRVRSHGGHRRR